MSELGRALFTLTLADRAGTEVAAGVVLTTIATVVAIWRLEGWARLALPGAVATYYLIRAVLVAARGRNRTGHPPRLG